MKMRTKNSSSTEAAKEAWRGNLQHFKKSKRLRKNKMQDALFSICKMPTILQIMSRYTTLASICKNVKGRIQMISEECLQLWANLNFPTISKKSVPRIIEKIVKQRKKYVKRPDGSKFHDLLDITNKEGLWLHADDKNLYLKQLETCGRVGYSTMRTDDSKKIHPSKLVRKQCTLTKCSSVIQSPSSGDSSESDNGSDY
jgi:hypothetical protein